MSEARSDPRDWLEAATGVGPLERARLSSQAHEALVIEAHREIERRKVKRALWREYRALDPADQLSFLSWASREHEMHSLQAGATVSEIEAAFACLPRPEQRGLLARLLCRARDELEAVA